MKYHILSILGCIFVIASCASKEEEIAVASISVGQSTAEMIIGETLQLQATITPSNATDKTVIWATSKQSVATVSNNGLVTAIAEGTSMITATAGGKASTCQITVSKNVVAVTSVTLSQESLTLTKGESATLQATVNPADATEKTVNWASSDTAIATVDSNGKVTGVAGGNTIITAKVGDKQASCTVTVTVPIESISLDRDSITLEEGATATLVATVKPEDATDKTVTWESSDTSIATVEQGKVTAVKEGTAIVTARAGDKSAECKITVSKKVIAVTSIELNKSSIELVEGDSETLTATVKPEDATDKTVTWNSSDTSIVTVEQGKVTAVKEGTAIITAKAGDKEATCIVTVTLEPSQIIEFADTKVKEKMVAAFDTSGDGELSLNEAAAVKSADDIKTAFGAIKTYKSFDEFQFFTGITRVVDDMFSGWNLLASIVLPEQIQTIGSWAFGQCVRLSSIVIPDGTITINSAAFYGCTNLSSISIPNSVSTIGDHVFVECTSLASIIIPDGVTTIRDYSFYGCTSLLSITIPKSVSSIGNEAFSNCINLHEVYINSLEAWVGIDFHSAPFGYSESGHLYLSGVELTDLVIPNGVTKINPFAFNNCISISSVELPGSVSDIGDAFIGCTSLTSINIPESVVSIYRAFCNCTSLSSIFIPESVTEMKGAFEGCSSLASVTIPESVSDISEAFSGCTSLSSIDIPESVTNISNAFMSCTSLTSISIPESVTNIRGSFARCTNLSSVFLPNGMISINDEAFIYCTSLTSISIPDSVTSIGKSSFEGSGLVSIVLPEKITRIGSGSFAACRNLESITVKAKTVPSGGNTMFPVSGSYVVYVPSESIDEYKNADYWCNYADRIQAIQD